MNIPPFWARARHDGVDARGRPLTFLASGWSFSSLQEAKEEAAARARRVFEIFLEGREPRRYEYGDRPIREEIVQEIAEGEERIAVVTRNRYGALVLNCSNALFADVDFPKTGSGGLIAALLCLISPKRAKAAERARVDETVAKVREWAHSNPGRSFRLYRTKEGLRLLFTDKAYDPASEEAAGILSGLGADPMYIKLTRNQRCFRARLTAKPWRCGFRRPPAPFPWADQAAEAAFREWEEAYTKRDAGFKVCEFLAEFGKPGGVAALRTIVDLHDRGTRVGADAALA